MPQRRAKRTSRHLIRTRELFIAACFVFISLGVVAAWFVSSEPASSIAGIEPYVRFMLSPWMLVTHVLALSFMAFGLWFLGASSLRPSAVADFDATLRQCGRLLALVLVLFACALAVVGYLFVDDLRATFRSQRLSQEEGIARLKAQQAHRIHAMGNLLRAQHFGGKARLLLRRRSPSRSHHNRLVNPLRLQHQVPLNIV